MTQELNNNQELNNTKESITRCNSAEKEMRINETVELLCNFNSYGDICKSLQDKYGISRKTAEWYLQQAREIVISTIPKGPEIVGKHIKFYERIIKRNEITDPRTAMIGSVNLEKLLHLHNPEIQLNQQFNTLNLEGVDIQEVIDVIKTLKQEKEE